MSMYHEGQRELQDRYHGRAVADRLEQHRMNRTFTDNDRDFIETSRLFFLATAWGESVDCSMKGGSQAWSGLQRPTRSPGLVMTVTECTGVSATS